MMKTLFLAMAFLSAGAAWATEEELSLPPDPVAPQVDETLPSLPTPADLQEKTASPQAPLLAVNGRLDLAFSGGAPVAQGFYIPSLRLGAHGTLSRRLEYGLSLGQTREFSSAQLPQMLPVDAFMVVKVLGADEEFPLMLKLGMFNPTLNPWWSPDLAELSLPDYQTNHRALLLDNDVGVELQFQPGTERLKIRLGLFNGNGIYSLNTNNARAFNVSIETNYRVGDATLLVGLSSYTQTQSAAGSVNYKSNWLFDGYASIQNNTWLIGADILSGGFEDSTRTVYPLGTGFFILSQLTEDLHAYGRYEYLQNSPTSGGDLTTWQLGPMITIDRNFKAFFYYESTDSAAGIVSSGQVRLRLVM